jgi:bisphosphoglycerate-independent phosphoglycerate mutase (AlkP superfamily)
LGNIAPTILDLMGVEKPAEMTANSLLWWYEK